MSTNAATLSQSQHLALVLNRLRANLALANGRTHEPELSRYEHGGGRMTKEHNNRRNLVADFYDEGNREFFAACSVTAERAWESTIAAIETLKDAAAHCGVEWVSEAIHNIHLPAILRHWPLTMFSPEEIRAVNP